MPSFVRHVFFPVSPSSAIVLIFRPPSFPCPTSFLSRVRHFSTSFNTCSASIVHHLQYAFFILVRHHLPSCNMHYLSLVCHLPRPAVRIIQTVSSSIVPRPAIRLNPVPSAMFFPHPAIRLCSAASTSFSCLGETSQIYEQLEIIGLQD